MNLSTMKDFATRYTAAWCSHESLGHFDEAEYQRQIKFGADAGGAERAR